MSIRARVEQLSGLQEVVAEVYDTHVRKATLIASLPVDLKLEIFLHAYHDVIPLVLGAVCKEWRDIVWNTPRLWDTIDLVMSQNHYEMQILILKHWLERSGQCPLSITLHYRIQFDDRVVICEEYPELGCLPLLFAQSYRWEHINFDFPQEDIVNMIRKPGHLPLLRSLSLHLYLTDGWFSCNTRCHLCYFAEAPLLRSANLIVDLVVIFLPWKQLEILNFRFHDTDYLFTILKQAQNLKHCRLISSIHHHLFNKKVELPKLQSLTLLNYETLQMMDLPSLKYLQVRTQCRTINMDVLSDLVRRSFCHITTLDARADKYTGDFMGLMREIPSLLKLHLSLEEIEEELGHRFIEALHPDCEAPFLPNLEVLTYTGRTGFHYPALLDVVEQRWKKGLSSRDDKGHDSGSVAQFKSVRIHLKNGIPGAGDLVALEKLQKLRNDGLDIVVSSGTASW